MATKLFVLGMGSPSGWYKGEPIVSQQSGPTAASSIGGRQYFISDIELDDNNDMIIGLQNRRDHIISGTTKDSVLDPTTYGSSSSNNGDILRACFNGSRTWDIEDNGSCGGITTYGEDSISNPLFTAIVALLPKFTAYQNVNNYGGGEYYWQDGTMADGAKEHSMRFIVSNTWTR